MSVEQNHDLYGEVWNLKTYLNTSRLSVPVTGSKYAKYARAEWWWSLTCQWEGTVMQ